MTMAAKISFEDDTVKIVVDKGSSVRNVRVAGKRISIEREVSWTTVLGRALFYLGLVLFCLACWAGVFYAFERLAFGQSSPGQSSPGQCELIKDHDQRQYCRACATGRTGTCEFIKDRDLRHKCRALCKSDRN